MSLQKVNLLFLYDEKSNQDNIIKLLSAHVNTLEKAHSFDLSAQNFDTINMILIKELGSTKELQLFSRNLRSKNINIPILLIAKEDILAAFKESRKTDINGLISLPIDKDIFMNVLNKNALHVGEELNNEYEILRSVLDFQKNMFLLRKKDVTIYRSAPLLELCSQDELAYIIENYQEKEEVFLTISKLNNKEFRIKSTPSQYSTYDTLVSLKEVAPKDPHVVSTPFLSKEVFYEFLKSHLSHLEKDEEFVICNIQVLNHEDLEKAYGKVTITESLHKLMHEIHSLLSTGKLSFWHERSLLLALNKGFKPAKEIITLLQTKITDRIACGDAFLKVIISITPLSAKESMESCLSKIDSLSTMLKSSKGDVFVASTYDAIDNDNQKIIAMLHDVLNAEHEDSRLSLTSFYKGLVIYNNIEDASIDLDGVLSLKTEVVQCLAMSIEKHVIMHSPLMPNDILCQLKYVNSRQRTAQIHDFRILESSYKQRKFPRLEPSKHTPVTLIIDKVSITGKVLDLSMNSISIFVTNNLIKNYKKDTLVTTAMNLVLSEQKKSESVRIESRIINIFTGSEGFKVILGLSSDEGHTKILSEYLKQRRKELIGELRNLLKVT